MTKNLMPIIAKELGVEIGEEFELQGYPGSKHRLNEDKLEVSFGSEWIKSGLTINALGNIEVIKLPYKPKYGDKYWTYVTPNFNIIEYPWTNCVLDFVLLKCGCCFRTKKEAVAARPAKYQTLTGKEWKDG